MKPAHITDDTWFRQLITLTFLFSLCSSSVPSQPPQNVRAISVTSDEAVITWAEPPRMTLHGVLKGYRVVFWAVFPDGGELDVSVLKGPDLLVRLQATPHLTLPYGGH